MRALVTGGAGFIGSHTVDLLPERGYKVRILDNLQPRVHPRGKPPWMPKEAEFILGDVANPDDLSRAIRDVDCVFHLAAYQDYMPTSTTSSTPTPRAPRSFSSSSSPTGSVTRCKRSSFVDYGYAEREPECSDRRVSSLIEAVGWILQHRICVAHERGYK